MVEGLFHVPGFLSGDEVTALIAFARGVCTEAPLRRPTMPDGTPLKLTLTNAGDFGWWSDRPLGYRYIVTHPTTKKEWPRIPMGVQLLAARALSHCGLPPMLIENCLVNSYAPGESLGLHVDRTEEDKNAPIISFSVGADAEFLMGGREKSDRTESTCLQSGDLVIQSGLSRHCFHGVRKIFQTMGNPLKNGGRLNFTLRKVTRDRHAPHVEPVSNTAVVYDDQVMDLCLGCGNPTADNVCPACIQKTHG